MNKEQTQQLELFSDNEEHLYCGTKDCCMKCDTAVPVQLELFPDIEEKK